MSRYEWGMADKPAVTVEQRDLDCNIAAFDYAQRCRLGRVGDGIAERNTFGLRLYESLSCDVTSDNSGAQRRRSAGLLRERSQCSEIERTALRMQIEQALRELGHLCNAAGDGDVRNRMCAQIFEHAADEVAHVDQCLLPERMQPHDSLFRGPTRCPSDVRKSESASDIDPLVDTGDPRGAGIRHHDARGAEDRQTADDAQARIERARRKRFAIRNCDFDFDVGSIAGQRSQLHYGLADHPARNRIYRGLADPQGQTRPCDRADAFACSENNTTAGGTFTYARKNKCAMGNVGIVASILDHTRGRAVAPFVADRESEGWPLASRQYDVDGIEKRVGEQRRAGSLGRRRGTGTRGPATPKWTRSRGHGLTYNLPGRGRHDRSLR